MKRRDRTRFDGKQTLKLLALALACCWLALLVVGILKKQEIARHAVADTQAELALLEERRSTLAANLAELDTERGQEASLRQNFGVARPGEEVIIVVPKKELPPPPELTFWQKVKETLTFW